MNVREAIETIGMQRLAGLAGCTRTTIDRTKQRGDVSSSPTGARIRQAILDPAYDFNNMPQQIRIIFADIPGYIPTALVGLTLDDALRICDRLNTKLDWTGMRGPLSPAGPCPPPAMKPPIEPGKPVYTR